MVSSIAVSNLLLDKLEAVQFYSSEISQSVVDIILATIDMGYYRYVALLLQRAWTPKNKKMDK